MPPAMESPAGHGLHGMELRSGYYGFGVRTHHRIGSGILRDQLLFKARALPAGPILQVAFVMRCLAMDPGSWRLRPPLPGGLAHHKAGPDVVEDQCSSRLGGTGTTTSALSSGGVSRMCYTPPRRAPASS